MGQAKPNARMLPAISATCAGECVRALRGDGISRSTGQRSNRSRSREALSSLIIQTPSPSLAEKKLLNFA
jgi:hypothetical protein